MLLNDSKNTDVDFFNKSLFINTPLILMPLDVIIYGSIFYPVIFLIGVIGNLLVIFVLVKEKQLRSFTNYLLANLSFADLMVLFTCVPSAFHDMYAKERWYLGKIACYLISFIENCMGIASILSIFMITFERYYVICKPLNVKSTITKSNVLLVIFIIWAISIFINLPFIYLTEYKLAKFYDIMSIEFKCNAVASTNWHFFYIVLINFIIYFAIGIVLLWMYSRISKYLKDSTGILASHANLRLNKNLKNNIDLTVSTKYKLNEKRHHEENSVHQLITIQTSNYNEALNIPKTTLMNVEETRALSPSNSINIDYLEKYIKPRKQIIFMLSCVIIVFYISIFPFKIWTLILLFFAHKPAFPRIITIRAFWYINITSRIFFFINSSINPILCWVLSKKFRQGFRKFYGFKRCNKDFNHKLTMNMKATKNMSNTCVTNNKKIISDETHL